MPFSYEDNDVVFYKKSFGLEEVIPILLLESVTPGEVVPVAIKESV